MNERGLLRILQLQTRGLLLLSKTHGSRLFLALNPS